MYAEKKILFTIIQIFFIILATCSMFFSFMALFRGYQVAAIAGLIAVILLCFLILIVSGKHNVKATIAKIFDIDIK